MVYFKISNTAVQCFLYFAMFCSCDPNPGGYVAIALNVDSLTSELEELLQNHSKILRCVPMTFQHWCDPQNIACLCFNLHFRIQSRLSIVIVPKVELAPSVYKHERNGCGIIKNCFRVIVRNELLDDESRKSPASCSPSLTHVRKSVFQFRITLTVLLKKGVICFGITVAKAFPDLILARICKGTLDIPKSNESA